MAKQELIPHLFRSEFRKITAVLCKHLGIDRLETAEDIASETFLAALDTWPYQGIPENPVGWLYTVAKNKARNILKREQLFANRIAKELASGQNSYDDLEPDLSDANIRDSQLQMMFTICHPSIPPEGQVALALRVLCGFGIDEIATAFLSNRETINKRLFRAKEKLRSEGIKIELPPPAEIRQRLGTVLTTLYLLFNEGYYSESNDVVLREDLCQEAMRLTQSLLENPDTSLPDVNALMALMCFHASRFEARKNSNGELVLYGEQDETRWDQQLVSRGGFFLKQASTGDRFSKYHLEASIAYWHTVKADSEEKWNSILYLYDLLLATEYSSIAALNRAYALSRLKNRETAIVETEKLALTNNPYYFTLLGELYTGIDDNKAAINFTNALGVARSATDKKLIEKKLTGLSLHK